MVKRIVTMLLVCVTILSASVMLVVAADITPYYNNVNRVDSNAWISDAGGLSVEYDYTGNADTTSVVITTTVERKTLFFFWSDVDEWTDTIYDTTYYDVATVQLEKTGKYRVTVEYVFYGTGGDADTVTHEFELEY